MHALYSDIFEGIKRVAKKIQGALPIIGLVSRLATPGGGFDEQVGLGCQTLVLTAGQEI